MKKLIRITLAWCNSHELIITAVAGGLAAGLVYSFFPIG